MARPVQPRWARVSLALALLALAAPAPRAESDLPGASTAERPSHALARVVPVHGGDVDAGALAPPAQQGEAGPADRQPSPGVWIVLDLSWRDAEPRPGAFELEPLAARLEEAASGGRPVVLRLVAEAPAHVAPGGPERRRAWLGFVREAVRAAAPRVRWYVVDGLLAGVRTGAAAAYEVKSASVTVRAEAEGAGVAVGVRGSEQTQTLLAAYRDAGDLAPYVDAVVAPAAASEGGVEALRVDLYAVDPGVSVWVDEPARPGAPADELLARGMERIDAGADLVAFDLPPGDEAAAAGKALAAMARALPKDAGLSPKQGAGIELVPAGAPVRWTRLFDEERFTEIVVYWAGPGAGDADARFRFDATLRRGYRVVDPLADTERFVRAEPAADGRVEVTVPLSRQPRLLLVTRQRRAAGIGADEEQADVRAVRGVTAEEIIAAHQRWRAFQDDRLRTIRRSGRITFRPRFGQFTGTADLTIDGDYFWDPATGGEWVIREKYFNGVRLNWDELPEIPLIRWEQVIQAPLDLDLDKRYVYEFEDEETVDGRSCWRLSFRPLPGQEDRSLFRGRAWIDKRTGALVQVKSVQTGLEAPVLSREETRLFRPYEGPDGTEYWVLDELDGQILQSVAGSNLVILQQWRFGEPVVNGADFSEVRAESYASKRQMLRDTPEGFKWLVRTDDGGRVVREEAQTSQWFAAAGVLKDEGLDGVIPLAGVNYVDLDAFDRGLLFNALLAGPLANVTLSDPSFLDSRWDVGANLNAIAIPATDRVFVAGDEVDALRVGRVTQSLTLHAGHPVGDFVKLRGGLGIDYVDYRRDDDSDASLVIPSDHVEVTVSLSAAFDRGGWGVAARAARTARSEWEPWGGAAGSPLVTGEALERAEDFTTWSLQGQKSWFLRAFQKIEVDATWQGGSDLDRFSAFTFGFLSGNRVRGFGGSGIRYDRGTLVNVEYEFNLKEIIRFDADVDHAVVRELTDGRTSSHTGIGFAASFPGPWETLVRLDVGYALKSDIEEVEGDTEFLLIVLRLF